MNEVNNMSMNLELIQRIDDYIQKLCKLIILIKEEKMYKFFNDNEEILAMSFRQLDMAKEEPDKFDEIKFVEFFNSIVRGAMNYQIRESNNESNNDARVYYREPIQSVNDGIIVPGDSKKTIDNMVQFHKKDTDIEYVSLDNDNEPEPVTYLDNTKKIRYYISDNFDFDIELEEGCLYARDTRGKYYIEIDTAYYDKSLLDSGCDIDGDIVSVFDGSNSTRYFVYGNVKLYKIKENKSLFSKIKNYAKSTFRKFYPKIYDNIRYDEF